jgi:hypothetical protein
MGFFQDCPARSFINTTALHADKAVFHQVNAADTVFATQFIELGEQVGR